MNTQEKSSKIIYCECSKWAKKWTARKMDRITHNSFGFTLIELLVVCALLGILALMAFPAFSEMKTKAITAKAIAEIRGLEKDIIAYATDRGVYPPDLNAIDRGNQLDPWKFPYIYTPGGGYLDMVSNPINDDFDLYSRGIDGNTDADLSINPGSSMDDIIRVRNGNDVVHAANY